MAIMERPRFAGYTLWISNTLPSDSPRWELLSHGDSRLELEQKRRSLAPMSKGRCMAVVEGMDPPYWQPRL